MSTDETRKFSEDEIECIDYLYYVRADPAMHRVHETGEPMIDPDFPGRWLTGYDCVCAAWYRHECVCGAFDRNAYK
jgi:hypothetical protein